MVNVLVKSEYLSSSDMLSLAGIMLVVSAIAIPVVIVLLIREIRAEKTIRKSCSIGKYIP